MENIDWPFLLLFAASAGLAGFWHSRGHGVLDILTAIFCTPIIVLLSMAVILLFFNMVFVTGDKFLAPSPETSVTIISVLWGLAILNLFFRNSDTREPQKKAREPQKKA